MTHFVEDSPSSDQDQIAIRPEINRVRFFATQEYFDLDLPIRNMVQNSNILKQKSADHFCIWDPKLLQT